MWVTAKGDCVEVIKTLDDNSIDSVVTDPPYALSFMGKDWDSFGDGKGYQKWCEEWARECLRVLKPGGYLLAFGGTRTYHRLACAIEDAGFEIRDSLHWIYGSGFPKSLNVSKAIDKAAGAEREALGNGINGHTEDERLRGAQITKAATAEAQTWEGWGTALKPAHEPIVMARKPLSEKTVAANVLKWGTGAIYVDGCRVTSDAKLQKWQDTYGGKDYVKDDNSVYSPRRSVPSKGSTEGRWPPNVILSGDAIDEIDRQSGTLKSPKPYVYQGKLSGPETATYSADGHLGYGVSHAGEYADTGGASRFFPCFKYNSKAPKKERPLVEVDGKLKGHSTVKPVALMRWLVRLVTPPGGIVLEPFMGSGATVEACAVEDFDCVAIDRDEFSIRLTEKRMEKYTND